MLQRAKHFFPECDIVRPGIPTLLKKSIARMSPRQIHLLRSCEIEVIDGNRDHAKLFLVRHSAERRRNRGLASSLRR
jgi:hypothetical protein